MTQAIRCSFPVYVGPPNPDRLQKFGVFLAEQFGWAGYRQEKCFTIRAEHPALFLKSGLVFTADAALLDRPQPAQFEVMKWEIGVGADNLPVIALKLRELKRSPFQSWFANLSDGPQTALALATVLSLLLLVVVLWGLIAGYPHPIGFWAAFARHTQGIVSAGFVLLIWIPYLRLRGRYEDAPFTREVLLWLCSGLTMIALITAGVLFSPDAPLGDNPDDAIRFLDGLKSNAATLWPLLASLLPWAIVAVKWLGLDLLGSVLSVVKDSRSSRGGGGA